MVAAAARPHGLAHVDWQAAGDLGGGKERKGKGRGREEAGRRGRGLAQFGRCMGRRGGLAGQVSQPNTAGPVAD